MVYKPSLFVFRTTETFVSTFLTSISAPLITAPIGSVTLPKTVADSDWANAVGGTWKMPRQTAAIKSDRKTERGVGIGLNILLSECASRPVRMFQGLAKKVRARR